MYNKIELQEIGRI